MVIHDRESLRLMIYERALFTVGRVVLGYKGRKIARERRREVRLAEVNRTTSTTAYIQDVKYTYSTSGSQLTPTANTAVVPESFVFSEGEEMLTVIFRPQQYAQMTLLLLTL